jgi:hypothetical protein
VGYRRAAKSALGGVRYLCYLRYRAGQVQGAGSGQHLRCATRCLVQCRDLRGSTGSGGSTSPRDSGQVALPCVGQRRPVVTAESLAVNLHVGRADVVRAQQLGQFRAFRECPYQSPHGAASIFLQGGEDVRAVHAVLLAEHRAEVGQEPDACGGVGFGLAGEREARGPGPGGPVSPGEVGDRRKECPVVGLPVVNGQIWLSIPQTAHLRAKPGLQLPS